MKFPVPLLAGVLSATLLQAENWPQFRGPTGQGLSTESNLPVRWSMTENVRWMSDVPGEAWSSPIVWNDRLFLTTTTDEGRNCHVLAYDRKNGELLWNRLVFTQPTLRKERRNSFATPTPVTDGERVYACFGDGSFAALEFNGEVAWTNRDYPFYSQHGLGASPILYENLLIMPRDGSSQGEDKKIGWQVPWEKSFLIALDKETGEARWQTFRGQSRISHMTPLIWTNAEGEDRIISTAGDVVQGYHPRTGKLLWTSTNTGEGVTPSPVIHDGLVITASGWGGRESTKAFKLGGEGDLGESTLEWEERRGMPRVPSYIVVNDLLFWVNDGGIAHCLDPETGEIHYQERLDGSFSASPVTAEGHLYYLSDTCETFVLKAEKEFNVVARNPLEGEVQASPAISQGNIFIRTATNLYCVGE